QVTEKITGNGATARTVYDKLGRVAYDINALNYVTAYAYDENNRVERTTRYITAITLPNTPLSVENITAALTPSAQDRITQTRYDDEGRVHYEIDGAGYAIGYTYNANGQ
ncbi:hypothetical protein, partial [Enterovibrio norvegicus]|uniref:hypothetical protein n=1 Tax=Enterovibrio norvegicus TaxID=188144 RepID=UPI00130191EE